MATIKSNVALSLGLVTLPVNVTTAVNEPKEVRLSTVCTNGHAPIAVKQRLQCPECGNDDRSSFLKGSNQGTSKAPHYVVVTPDEVTGTGPPESAKSTMPLAVHPAEQVETTTLQTGRVYRLEPAKGTEPQYALIVQAVAEHPERAFVTRWAARSRTAMYRLQVFNGALMAAELAWPEHVAQAPTVEAEIDEAMSQLLDQLIQGLASDFDPGEYTDERLRQITELIASREAGEPAPVAQLPAANAATDLMAQLQAAVAASTQKAA